jgi:glucosylceramidase
MYEHRPRFLRCLIILILPEIIFLANANSQKANSGIIKNNPTEGPFVSVYVSTKEGDRLAKKEDIEFSRGKNLSLPRLKVDESTRYQYIEGFGATFNESGMICLNALNSETRNGVLKALFDSATGAGFSLMKSPMAACDFSAAGPWYSYNDTRDDTAMNNFSIQRDLGSNGLVSYIRNASKFGKFRIETTMDFAPDWMMFGLAKGKKHIKPEYNSALAKYYSQYLQAYAANGIIINYLNPFNEADNAWYSNVTYAEIRDLIKFHIAPRLKRDGLSTKIQLCETANRPEAIKKLPIVLDDPEASKYINSLSVHGYDWDQYASLTDLHKKYPGFPIWQTEVCYALLHNIPVNGPSKLPVYEFSDGEFWGNMIINDMKNWVSAWIYWNMILDQDGGPWLISIEHGDPDNNRQQPVVIINRKTKQVSYTGLYYYLAHFSKFVRQGAYRIDCTGDSGQFNCAAFINVNGSIVLNLINNGPETEKEIEWRNKVIIHKFPAHSITSLLWNTGPR